MFNPKLSNQAKISDQIEIVPTFTPPSEDLKAGVNCPLLTKMSLYIKQFHTMTNISF